jgi:hypothetical protein
MVYHRRLYRGVNIVPDGSGKWYIEYRGTYWLYTTGHGDGQQHTFRERDKAQPFDEKEWAISAAKDCGFTVNES